jgi:hypothetical protein
MHQDFLCSTKLAGLTNLLNLAPCSEVAIVVAFQHIGQVYDHYGLYGGDAVLRSFKTKVFLPGLDRRTTEFAARLATLNAIQHAPIDEHKKTKGERLAEAKRVLVYEEELRQLDRHKRAIAVVGDFQPIKCSLPPLVQASPEELSRAANKGTLYVIDFQTAAAQYKGVGTETRAGTGSIPDTYGALFQPQNLRADEIQEERTQPRPQVPTVDGDSIEL